MQFIILGGFLIGAAVVLVGGALAGGNQARWEELNADRLREFHE